jgi:hypothetical protein
MNTQWLLSAVLRMKCTVFSSSSSNLLWRAMDTWQWTRLHLYSSKIQVKWSHYRPGQAVRVQRCWTSQISWHSAHECGKIVNLTYQPPLPSLKYSRYSFLLETESNPGPQCSWNDVLKNDAIGNQTCNLLACSAVPQPTAPLRTQFNPPTCIFIPFISHSSLQNIKLDLTIQIVKRRQQARPKHNYQCTWYYIPKDRNLHQYHSEPLTL